MQGALTFAALLSGVAAGGFLAAALACYAMRARFSRNGGFAIACHVCAAICVAASIANF
jgi:hypothetical protein